MKKCSKCNVEKELSEFYVNIRSRKCKACHVAYGRDYQRRDYVTKKRLEYYKSEKYKIYSRSNKIVEYHAEYAKEYRKSQVFKNYMQSEGFKKRSSAYTKERRRTDVAYKLSITLRSRFYRAIKKEYKRSSVVELLGCSIPELKCHIEKQFQTGMTWDNHGLHGWHIDHIVPVTAFDFKDADELERCFHYTNLQPLWAVDNIKKGGIKNKKNL